MKGKLLFLCAILAVVSVVSSGQTSPNLENGFKPYGSYQGSELDTVNVMNGNLMWHVPMPWSYPQRGGRIGPQNLFTMSSKGWSVQCTYPPNSSPVCSWSLGVGISAFMGQAGSGMGFDFAMDMAVHRTWQNETAPVGGVASQSVNAYSLTTADGSSHQLAASPNAPLDSNGFPLSMDAVDTTGYHLDVTSDPTGPTSRVVVTDRHGNQHVIPHFGGTCSVSHGSLPGSTTTTTCNQVGILGSITDGNGNVYALNPGSAALDTMGRSYVVFNSSAATSDYSNCVSGGLPMATATIFTYVDAGGVTNQIKACYATLTISTAFGEPGVSEAQNTPGGPSPLTATPLVTLIMPDGGIWTFSYDSYVNLTKVGLPLGGSISYTWTTLSHTSANCGSGMSRAVASRTITDNNGHSSTWNYIWGTLNNQTLTNTVTDPLLNDTVHVFSALLAGSGCYGGYYESSTQYYQGTGSSRELLKQVDTQYSSALLETQTSSALANVVPTSIRTTVYPSGKVSQVNKSYDPGLGSGYPIFGQVVQELEYDWGQGSPGALLRETDTTYQWQVNGAYLAAHMLDLPATLIVKDGSGCAVSETDYTYDESAYLTSYTGTVGALPSGTQVAAPNPVRGNLTTLTKWLAPGTSCNPKGGTAVATHTNWYDTGEIYQQIDPLGRTTTHSYDPAYAGAYSTRTCSPATNGGATTHCVSGTYDFTKGLLTSFTNENATQQASGNTPGDSAHTTVYSYDFVSRLTSATFPPDTNNGGSQAVTRFSYPVPLSLPFAVTKTRSITATQTDTVTSTYDGLGRVYKTQHPLPNGTAEVDTSYDALGRVSTVSNPYFSTSDPTYGVTQTAYDALGRATQITEQDGSVKSVAYSQGGCSSGDDTTTTDEAAKPRRACTDALGRLVEVDEPGDPIVNFNAAAAPASGVYSMTGFPDSSGEHDAYVGTDQHIYQLFLTPSGWVNQDLTAYTNGALAAAGSAMTSFTDSNGEHLLYVGANQHVYQMYFSVAQWQWYNQDLTALTGNTLASLSTGLSSFSDSAGEHVMYVATSQQICQLFYSSSTGWQNQDITAITGGTLAANATGLSNFSDASGAHVAYEGINQHIYQFFLSPSGWVNQDLTAYGNGPLAALPTPLSSMVDSFGEHVFYFGTNQHVDQLGYSSTSGWASQDLTAVTGSTPAATGSPLSSFADADGEHILYQGTNQHINQLYFSVAQWQWYDQDLTAWTASAGANGGGLAAFADSQGEQVFYTNGQQVNELEWNGTAWQFANVGGPSLGQNFFVTQYGYDGLGNLLSVTQKGDPSVSGSSQWRTRSFTYDTLGRLLTATNPESGKISYTYDANGNLLMKTSPAPNQIGSATQIISYCYDELGRPTGKAYSAQSCPLSSPVVSYVYDQGANAKGKLTSLADQAGSGAYTYDVLGRMATEQRMIAGVSKNMSYGYNLDGSLKMLTYPSGATVTYTVDSAGRDISAIDSGNGINYATSANYDAAGNITGFVSGNSGSFAGITNAFSYNQRLQPVTMSAAAPSATVFSLGYDFHLGNGNNGNVFGITNYKDTSRNQSFTYDSLNRLTSAQNAGTNCSAMTVNGKTEYWGNSYGYDPWGNLLAKTITKCGAENLSVTADANNHLQGGYTYDAAGNMLHDSTANLNYSYDQENRITGAAGYTYTYDGDGNRVEKSNGSTGTLYWYMSPGIVAESDLSGNLKSEYVFFDGERVARKDFPGLAVSYYFSDHLKTTDLVTDAQGNIKNESDFYPWGGELEFLANDSNHYKFTGKERDSETGLDYFGARYYSNGLGRFITPDWAAKAAAVPYAEFTDPQSLNLYSYVRNVPTSKADVDGHCDWCHDVLEAIAGTTYNMWSGFRAASNAYHPVHSPGGDAQAAETGVGSTPDYVYTPSNVTQQEVSNGTAAVILAAGAIDGGEFEEAESAAAGAIGGAERAAEESEAAGQTATRGGETADTALGRQKHAEFAEKVKQKPGWQSEPRLKDPQTGKTVKPDAVSKQGRPVELKPKTPSGKASGRSQIKKYQRATGKRGRVVYYDKDKK